MRQDGAPVGPPLSVGTDDAIVRLRPLYMFNVLVSVRVKKNKKTARPRLSLCIRPAS